MESRTSRGSGLRRLVLGGAVAVSSFSLSSCVPLAVGAGAYYVATHDAAVVQANATRDAARIQTNANGGQNVQADNYVNSSHGIENFIVRIEVGYDTNKNNRLDIEEVVDSREQLSPPFFIVVKSNLGISNGKLIIKYQGQRENTKILDIQDPFAKNFLVRDCFYGTGIATLSSGKYELQVIYLGMDDNIGDDRILCTQELNIK